jgi:Domain of unknown function (DUF4279)
MEKPFRTLRGFLKGTEREEDTYFAYSATLRIAGEIPDLDEISAALGLSPTHSHRKGERRGAKAAPYRQDMWSYSPPVEKSELLHRHIDALWLILKPHKDYLLELKKSLNVDVFVGYRSNCDTAGVEVPHTSLEMFTELEIPFGVSIIVT